MASATFQKPPQVPPLFTGTTESIITDTKKLIEASKSIQDKLAAQIKAQDATFSNVLLPLAYDENNMSLSSHILGFYQAVSPAKELRDASTQADELLDEFGIESAMREDIYKLVKSVYDRKEKLEPESQRFLEKVRKQYIQNGLNLEAGPKRDRFKQIKLRLSQLSISFQKTLNEENGGIWFKPEELDGISKDIIEELEKGEGENAGKLRLTFKYTNYFPAVKHAKNPETRKRMFVGMENRCMSNVPLLKEALVLRDEAARLLGYPDHATYRIEDKMAKTPQHVNEFLGDLRTRLTPMGDKELEVLKKLKKEDVESSGGTYDGHFYHWDYRYYNEIQLARDYQVDQQKLSEYFPIQVTLSKMLQIFETILGLKFVEVKGADRDNISPTGKGDSIVWHEDVQLFAVWNDESQGNGFVGYLYTDLHPRLGK
jgi:metallopeptidase MepB